MVDIFFIFVRSVLATIKSGNETNLLFISFDIEVEEDCDIVYQPKEAIDPKNEADSTTGEKGIFVDVPADELAVSIEEVRPRRPIEENYDVAKTAYDIPRD